MIKPDTQSRDVGNSADARTRILGASAEIIASVGLEAATTRAIAHAADVQAPTIYRLFGDKQGLVDAVAEHVLQRYVAEKSRRKPHADPVQDLRDGWDMHVAFGLAHPELFAVLNGEPQTRLTSSGQAAGIEVLSGRVRAIALAGRLKVSEERAIALLQAVGTGAVFTLLGQPEAQRDLTFSEFARESVMTSILSDDGPEVPPGANAAAAALRAKLSMTSVLSRGEKLLLEELLNRIADGR